MERNIRGSGIRTIVAAFCFQELQHCRERQWKRHVNTRLEPLPSLVDDSDDHSGVSMSITTNSRYLKNQ